MSSSKVIILTGASRGIGLAMAKYLLKGSNKLVLVARTAGPMEDLKKQYPGQVEVITADLADFSVAEQATTLALKVFSRIDGLVINHGVLSPVKRISDSTVAEWQEAFNVNFFSAVSFVKAALPSLRSSHGKIIMVSSGAAASAYSTWGAYGSSKAAMNHLALTLKVEEPDITSIAIRPGVVDTAMQKDIREVHHTAMGAEQAAKFKSLHESGSLLKPEQPGNVMCRLVLDAPSHLSGMFLTWNDGSLKEFQD